jgi:hypothetical protein
MAAFLDRKKLKKYVNDIAWESVVWIAEKESYAHLIHLNGDRFLEPG